MATVEIENSNLVSTIQIEMDKRLGGFIPPKDAVRMYKTMFIGATAYLAAGKTTKNPEAFTVENQEGNYIVGAVVEYNEAPEEEDDVLGNWMYYWTFNKSDIPENATVYEVKNTQTHEIIATAAWEHTSARFEGTESMINTFILGFDVLKDHLMENAIEGDTYELVYPGVFKAMAAIEDGEKVISITPDGLIKKMIKDDAALEEKAKTA